MNINRYAWLCTESLSSKAFLSLDCHNDRRRGAAGSDPAELGREDLRQDEERARAQGQA